MPDTNGGNHNGLSPYIIVGVYFSIYMNATTSYDVPFVRHATFQYTCLMMTSGVLVKVNWDKEKTTFITPSEFVYSPSMCCFRNSLYLIVPHLRHMTSEKLVNIGSGNGLLPDGTKPLPEPMLSHHQRGNVEFIWGQFHDKFSGYMYIYLIRIRKLLIQNYSRSSHEPMIQSHHHSSLIHFTPFSPCHIIALG